MAKAFERILIVMLENQYRSYVSADPFMRKLELCGASLRNSFGAFHPSQTNYIASLAGEVCGVTNDIAPAAPLPQRTLIDVLEAAGLTWKAYMEGYPDEAWNPLWAAGAYESDQQPCVQAPQCPDRLPRYFRKHNAFASFRGIQSDTARWGRIVSEKVFWDDVASGAWPDYGWFSPDIWNDGHYLYNTQLEAQPRTQLIPQVSAWLEHVFLGDIECNILQDALDAPQNRWGLRLDVDLLLSDPERAWRQSRVPPGALLVITFDEADYSASGYDTNYDGPNQVYTVLLGDMIAPGTDIETPYNHYSLMRTVQRNFGTQDLGKNDRGANWYRFLWNEEFAWSEPADTGLEAQGDLALTATAGGVCAVFRDQSGGLVSADFDGTGWTTATPTGLPAAARIALADCDGQPLLVFSDGDGAMFTAVRQAPGSWSEPRALNQRVAGELAMTAYSDTADGQRKIMLCWTDDDGLIRYLVWQDGAWSSPAGSVGQFTDGPLALGQLGPSLYLVYKERNRRHMRMSSFNLAPFNAFAAQAFEGGADPANDTSLHQWSPFDVHVGYFAAKASAFQNDYRSIGRLAMASIDGEMHLAHRGGFDDVSGVFTEVFGLTGIFTAAHAMGHGWGTLDQAGWTREQPLPGATVDADGGIAMAGDGGELLLVWQDAGAKALRYCRGRYAEKASITS